MSNGYFTRIDVDNILNTNSIGANVYYLDRPKNASPKDFIIYLPFQSSNIFSADDSIHINTMELQVIHFHKGKLSNIRQLMSDSFNSQPFVYNAKQLDTDYYATYYRFDIMTDFDW